MVEFEEVWFNEFHNQKQQKEVRESTYHLVALSKQKPYTCG